MSAGAWRSGRSRRTLTLNLLKNLTLREIRSEYKRTVLGRLWSLISPLAQVAIYGVVFGVLFNGRPEPGINSGLDVFALWLAVGIVTWGFVNSGLRASMQSFVSYQGLLKKVALPRWTLPASKVLSKATTFLTEILVVAAVIGIVGGPNILWRIWMVLPLIIIATVFIMGFGLMLAIANVYFRDLEHLWSILTQVFFYASGVLIPVSVIESAQDSLDQGGYSIFGLRIPLLAAFEGNPVHQFLVAFRRVLYDFSFPGWHLLLSLSIWALVMLLLGILVYNRFQSRIVEEL